MFNTKDGFLEATVRGCVGGFLRTEDYSNLQQCETVEDIKLYLVIPISRSNFWANNFDGQTSTDYGSLLQNEASPTHPSLIVRCCLKKIVQDFSFFESQVSFYFQLFNWFKSGEGSRTTIHVSAIFKIWIHDRQYCIDGHRCNAWKRSNGKFNFFLSLPAPLNFYERNY